MNVEEIIDRIIDRAEKMGLVNDSVDLYRKDIEIANTVFDLDFERWLNADDFQFSHDWMEIHNNIDREKTQKFLNGELSADEEMFGFFVPRYAKN